MKKIILTIALGAVAGTGIVCAQSKFDGASRNAIDIYQRALANPEQSVQLASNLPFAFNPNARAATEAEVMVTLNKGCNASMLADLGYEILGDYGDVVILKSTVEKIIALDANDAVKSIAFSTPATPCNDNARADMNVNKVLAGTGLPKAYTGKGVVAAIFDTGSDPNHIMFRNADGTTRYKRFYNYGSSNGRPMSVLVTDSDIKKFTTENSGETHGTHTTGCMAGGFKGKTTKYMGNTSGVEVDLRGPASEADIIGAYGSLYPSSYLNFLEELDQYRKENGVPVVVNFSFGTHGGALDETSGDNVAMDRYGKNFPIFIASSNEGDICNGIVKDFTASDNILKTFIYPSANHENERMKGAIELWSKDNKPVKVTFVMYDKGTGKELAKFDPITGPSSTITYATQDYGSSPSYIYNSNFDKIYTQSYITVSSGINPANNRYYLTANIDCKFKSTQKRYVLAMYVEGEDGQHISLFNGSRNTESGAAGATYGTFRSLSKPGFTEGTPELSINRLACGKNTIVVGAYTTRMNWKLVGGSDAQYYEQYGYYQDKISPFSSYGILHDGTTRPHFIAPGAGIISSVSSYKAGSSGSASVTVDEGTRNNYFAVSQGTSMSTPEAAGVAVVMLQANPNLSPKDIRDILIQTARVDANLDCPVAQRGAGKIDAYEAVKKALTYSGVNDIIAGGEEELFIRPVGDNIWEVSFPGLDNIAASVYSVSGQKVADFATAGDTMEMNVSNLNPGIYVVNVNGKKSAKIVVK